jgi:hypothetical protein
MPGGERCRITQNALTLLYFGLSQIISQIAHRVVITHVTYM